MKRSVNWLSFALLSMMVVISAGCGGSGPSSGAGAAPAAVYEVTGVAATGAPVSNGIVYLKDSSDKPVEHQQSTRSDGSFTFDATGLKPPFFLKVSKNNQNLYSVATDFGMTNITPLTAIVVAQAAQRDDLDALYGAFQPADINAIAKKMPDADKAVQNMFAALMSDNNAKGSLVNGPFSANHAGYDALLDSISVTVAPGAITVTQKNNNSVLLNVAANQLGNAVLATSGTPAAAPGTAPAQDPPATASGSALYTSKCAGCHGDSANSNLIGKITVSSVQNAIASNLGGMSMLNGLSAGEIQSVFDYLASVAPAPSATPTPTTTPTTTTTTTTPTAPSDGAALYADNCADCHGDLASSLKKGITVVRLQNAIGGNIGGMGSLSTLSAADIQALVTSLNPPAPVTSVPADPAAASPFAPAPTQPPALILDGPALYADNCSGCHGPVATSSKKGITLARLQSAISNNIGNMGFLGNLTTEQQQSLVGVLVAAAPAPTPTPAPGPAPVSDGSALYATNCAGCHGSLASSSKKGITIARLQAAIASNTGGMGNLSALSVSDVQALVTVLTPSTPTPTPTPVLDGATLYSSNCASCHGVLSSSSKVGATASRIQSAITNNIGSMGSLSGLSSAQIAALGTVLATVVPTPAPVPTPTPAPGPTPAPSADGTALYGSNCAGCHGALASSSKAGRTATQIQSAINNNTGSMGSLSGLTSVQVTAIGTALASVTPSPVPAPTPACGSCHAIPLATGHHSTHKSQGVGCVTCHGAGYSTTTVNLATHNNGVKNIDTAKTGWNVSKRSCSNSCHGSKTW